VNDFTPSSSFTGCKEGFVYKNDIYGLGYYKDRVKVTEIYSTLLQCPSATEFGRHSTDASKTEQNNVDQSQDTRCDNSKFTSMNKFTIQELQQNAKLFNATASSSCLRRIHLEVEDSDDEYINDNNSATSDKKQIAADSNIDDSLLHQLD
jgi:hypothetical protein